MTLSTKSKAAINKVIFERAYEIENMLSENNFFMAKMVGVAIDKIEEVALKLSIKELKQTLSN